MQVYKIDQDGRRQGMGPRIMPAVVAAALFLGVVIIFVLRFLGIVEKGSPFTWLAGLFLLGAIVGAMILAISETLRRAEREMIFVLTEDGIARKRNGWPDIKIAFKEINYLCEELRWLVVRGAGGDQKIAIPHEVAGYEQIRAELIKRHPLIKRETKPVGGIVIAITAVASWAAMMLFRNKIVIFFAATLGLATLALGSYRLKRYLRGGPQLILVWLCLSSAWAGAMFLIYIQIYR